MSNADSGGVAAVVPAIAVETDGLPSDARLRRVAVAMLMRAKGGRRHRQRELVEKGADALVRRPSANTLGTLPQDSPKWELIDARRQAARETAKAVFESLLATNRLSGSQSFEYKPPMGRSGEDTREGKQANFTAAVERIASKVASSPKGRARAALLYRLIDAAGFYHRVSFADGKGVLVPTGFSISAQGLAVTTAIVVSATKKGIRCHSAPLGAIDTVWVDETTPAISVNPALCRRDIAFERKMDKLRLLSRSKDYGSELPHTLDTLRRDARKSLAGQREGVEAFLREEVSNSGWSSLNASLARRARKPAHFRMLFFSILDQRTRAACLRDPYCTVELYNWFCPRNETHRTRRLQASETYPLLTPRLKELSSVIDNADPLAPAVALLLDVPTAAVRLLVNLHWQRFGSPLDILRGSTLTHALRLAASIVPEDRPIKRSQWREVLFISQQFSCSLPYPPSPTVAHGLRRLASIRRLSESRIFDAVRDVSRSVLRASEKSWGEAGEDCIEDLIMRVAMGGNGSTKRLVAFSDAWHRGVARRNATLRAMERAASSKADDLVFWSPMTDTPFICEAGRMDWLQNEDELAAEGEAMMHCVGGHWYVSECYRGRSHIAAVTDDKGKRSTVEFRIEGNRILCGQNQAYGNGSPSDACSKVVASFLALANAKGAASIVDLKAVRAAAKARLKVRSIGNGYNGESVHYEAMTDDGAEALIRLYDDCLPPNGRLSPERWRELVEEEIACGRRGFKASLDELAAY